MAGGILGREFARLAGGVFAPNDVLERPELRYTPLWNPTTTAGLSCSGGAVSTTTESVLGGAALTWTKTVTNQPHSLVYGSAGIGTVSILDKRFCAVFRVGSVLAGHGTAHLGLQLGSAMTVNFGTAWNFADLAQGWHYLQFNANDMTTTEGSPSRTNISYIKFFVDGLPNATTFGAGEIIFDALLWR